MIMSTCCLNCKKQSQTLLELQCDHILCIECAQRIKIPEGQPPLDAKFKICCPACKRNTITLNIQNLICKNSDQLLFVNMESSELSEEQLEQGNTHKLSQSKLRKMSYTQRRSSVYGDRKTPDITQRNSKASHDSQRNTNCRSRGGDNIIDVKCANHKENIVFFCEQEGSVLCMQCMYRHMKEQKNHNVCSISDAVGTIVLHNKQFKLEARKRLEEIDKCMIICKGNKTRIQKAYEIHEQVIHQEFRELQKLIKKKEQQNKEYLDKIFKKKQKEIITQIQQLTEMKNCLKEHFQFQMENANSQIYFFNVYTQLRSTFNKISTHYKQIKQQDFFCFDKLTSIEDFSDLLQKFFRPKIDGRESKATKKQQSNAPSRASDQGIPVKIKKQLYQQTKKKLEKINKLENEQKQIKARDKRQDYLNNFFIEQIPKRDLDGSHPNEKIIASMVPSYRKSSASEYTNDKKTVYKTLTPTRMSNANNTKGKKK